MKNRLKSVLGAAAALLAACSGDPALFLGGPSGPVADVQISSQRFIVRAGESATIGVQPRDAVGNAAAGTASFAACDARVAVASGSATTQWAATATVSGMTLGESCVVVTVGSFTDTVRVAVGPGSIVITGPDTILSGNPASYGVEFYDLNGVQLTASADLAFPTTMRMVSLNSLRLPVTNVDGLNYDAAGQQPGPITLEVTTNADFGSVTASKLVTIVPGVFAGNLSAATGGQGDVITVTGPITFDGDEYVTVGGIPGAMWSGAAGDPMPNPASGTITFRVPWNLAPGSYQVQVVNQGTGQVAQNVTAPFTVTAGTPVVNWNGFPGTNTSGAELIDKISLDRPLAFPVVISASPNPQDRSYYTFDNRQSAGGNAGEKVLRITLDWVDSCGAVCAVSADEDVDIQIIDGGFTAFLDLDGATLAKPESTLFNFDNGDFYFVRYRTFSGAAQTHTVMQWLGDGNLCSDEGGCTIGGEN